MTVSAVERIRDRRDKAPHRRNKPRLVGATDEQQKYENIVRLIEHLGQCAGETDASVLKDLLSLKVLIDRVAREAARELVRGGPGRPPLTWGVIAEELGVTRQAVWQAWGKPRPGDAR